LAGVPTRADGALHGLVTWALATLALFYLLTTAVGAVLGSTASFLRGAAGVVSKTAGSSSPVLTNTAADLTGTIPQEIRNQAGDLINDPHFKTFISDVLHHGQIPENDRQTLVTLVSQHQNVSQAQADAEVTRWQQELQSAKTKAKSAADTAASGTAKAGIWSFVMLILALICGCVGGGVGAPENSMLIPIRVRALR
jgi:hypothetical protein